jgi:UDP-N-acetylglucosamine 2-epimerase (non-hydrolysing)
MKKIAIIVGTRPEVIKLSPIIEAIKSENGLEPIVISSGQQGELLNQTMHEFGIVPKFKAELNFRNSSLFNHVATLTEEIGNCLELVQPSFILTQGDTSSAFAGTLSGFLLGIPVGHVEAGLRSQNLKSPFPEEGYRQLISRIASIHFAPTELAAQNLLAEGIDSKVVKVVGNPIVDAIQNLVSSFANNPRTKKILVTLHRRENFGEPLAQIAQAIGDFAKSHKEVIFNVIIHPNPNSGLFLSKALSGFPNINLLPPLNYRDLLSEILTSAAVFPPVPPVNVTPLIMSVCPAVRAPIVTVATSVELFVPSVLAIVGIESLVTILPTLPLLTAVAVTVLAPLFEPVVKPSAKVPLKLPLVSAVGLAAAAANADMPDFKLENAAANSIAVVVAVEVKVSPFSVKP